MELNWNLDQARTEEPHSDAIKSPLDAFACTAQQAGESLHNDVYGTPGLSDGKFQLCAADTWTLDGKRIPSQPEGPRPGTIEDVAEHFSIDPRTSRLTADSTAALRRYFGDEASHVALESKVADLNKRFHDCDVYFYAELHAPRPYRPGEAMELGRRSAGIEIRYVGRRQPVGYVGGITLLE